MTCGQYRQLRREREGENDACRAAEKRAETPFEVTEPAAEDAIAYCREIDRVGKAG